MKLTRWVLVVLTLFLLAPEAGAQGNCGVYEVYTSNQVLTASSLNSNLTQAATTNSTLLCLNDTSGTLAAMQVTVDPTGASLATSAEGEIHRLRFMIGRITGQGQWYQNPSPLTPPGDIHAGVASSRSAGVVLFHASSAFRTGLYAGNATASADYFLPTGPGTSGQPLTWTSGNQLSWATLGATVGGTAQTAWTTGDVLYASASDTLARLAIGSASQVLTVSGGVPAWAAASAGAVTRIGGNTTEATTTATATASLLSITVTSTAATAPILCTWNWRKTAPGTASTLAFNLDINATTNVIASGRLVQDENVAANGSALLWIGPRVTSYLTGLVLWSSRRTNDQSDVWTLTDMPTAAITTIVLRGHNGGTGGAATIGYDEAQCYSWSTS